VNEAHQLPVADEEENMITESLIQDDAKKFLEDKKASFMMNSLLKKLSNEFNANFRVCLYLDDETSEPDVVVQYSNASKSLKEICSSIKDQNVSLLKAGVRVNFVELSRNV